MGWREKLTARLEAGLPDHPAVIAETLGPDDAFVADALVLAAAFERGGGGGDGAQRLLRAAVDKATNAVSASRHIGGDDGTVARSIPRDTSSLRMALSARGLSFWDFGLGQDQVPPRLAYRIAGEHVASFVATGEKAQGGMLVHRLTFTDGSFFDYRVDPRGTALVGACAARWPAA